MRCLEFEPHIPELDRIPALPAMEPELDVYISKNHFYLFGVTKPEASEAAGLVGSLIGGPILGSFTSGFASKRKVMILKVPWSDVIWVKADKTNRGVIILAKVNGKKFLMPLTESGPGVTINKMIDLLEKYVGVETIEIRPYSDITP